ncbi:unnamed protein product [Urochloa decumbens]|uniref:Uncharacterized protein n=1 Tax=Urochloa decumbens TaxID=240449 RepID=A0ABC9G7X5_9POAL
MQTCSTSVVFPTFPGPTIGRTPKLQRAGGSSWSKKLTTRSISIWRPNMHFSINRGMTYEGVKQVVAFVHHFSQVSELLKHCLVCDAPPLCLLDGETNAQQHPLQFLHAVLLRCCWLQVLIN